MALPLTLFILSFDDLQIRFHLGPLSMRANSPLDLSMGVQIHAGFVSIMKQNFFLFQLERFGLWKTHSTR